MLMDFAKKSMIQEVNFLKINLYKDCNCNIHIFFFISLRILRFLAKR